MTENERSVARWRRVLEVGWAAVIAEDVASLLGGESAASRVAPESWPRIVLAVSRLRRSADRGVGDTVHGLLEPLGGTVFERWYERVMGRPCGCQDRRGRLNAAFPYEDGPAG